MDGGLLDLLGFDLPDFGAYGVVFMSESQREIFSRDEDLQWYSAGVASWDPAPQMYVLQRVEDAGGVGTLTITLTFDDR